MTDEEKKDPGLPLTHIDRVLQLAFAIVTIAAFIFGWIVYVGHPCPLSLRCSLVAVGTVLAFVTLLKSTGKPFVYRRSVETIAVLFSAAAFGLADDYPRELLPLYLVIAVAYAFVDASKLLKCRPMLARCAVLAFVTFHVALFLWSLMR